MKNIIKILIVALVFILATNFDSQSQVRKRLASATEVEGSETFTWTSGVWYGKNQRVSFALEVETTASKTEFAGSIYLYGSWNGKDYDGAVASATFTMAEATARTVEAISVSDFTYPYVKCTVTAQASAQTVNVTPYLFSVDK